MKNNDINDIQKRLLAIEESIIKMNRDRLDEFYNLDFENMSVSVLKKMDEWSAVSEWKSEAVSSLAELSLKANANGSAILAIAQWKSDMTSSLASISQKANANESSINSLAQWKSEAVNSIASISQKANSNESAINSLAQWKSEAVNSIASISQKANENESAISAINQFSFTKNGVTYRGLSGLKSYSERTASDAIDSYAELFAEVADSSGNVTAASVIAAVNGGSSTIKLNADRIEFNSNVYFYAKYNGYDFGNIKTAVNAYDSETQSQYAMLISTSGKKYGSGSNYPVALKLESAGNMSFNSGYATYMSADKYLTLDALLNTRIRANQQYSDISTYGPNTPSQDDYVFCSDGIYKGGVKYGGSGGVAVFG